VSLLNIRVTESRPFTKTVHLQGRLTNDTVAILDAELEKITNSAATTVVVFELTHLDYISSVGLRSIFRTHKALAAQGGKALLVNPQPQIKKVIDIVNAADISAVFTSTEELDKYLDMMQRRVVEGE
jgi:anti-anti-sigma factor